MTSLRKKTNGFLVLYDENASGIQVSCDFEGQGEKWKQVMRKIFQHFYESIDFQFSKALRTNDTRNIKENNFLENRVNKTNP